MELAVESCKLVLVEPNYIDQSTKLIYLVRTKEKKYYLLTFSNVCMQLKEINSFSERERLKDSYSYFEIKRIVELVSDKSNQIAISELNEDLVLNCYNMIFKQDKMMGE